MNDAAPPPPPPLPTASVPSVAPASPLVFSGDRSEFRRLVVRGAMLELITVGFYRFWLATDMRRHLWSHTSVEGDAPEYTGTAKELFIGFLVALAILVPIYLAYFLLTLEAERLRTFASVPLILFYYFFAQFAFYRARRYRLTRTIWRGVRFGMGGSGVSYALRVALWSLLLPLTLGIILPWRQASLERYKLRHTAYGSLPGRFDGTGWDLFKQIWWICLLPTLVLAITISVAAIPSLQTTPVNEIIMISLALGWIGVPFVYAIYKASEWRWWVSGVRFGDVSFHSEMRKGALIAIYWKLIGWGFLLLMLLSAWIGSITFLAWNASDSTAPAGIKMMLASQQLRVWIPSTIGYLLTALVLVLIMRIYLIRDVWQRVAGTASVYNLAAADDVAVQGAMASAVGEGFADSLDIGGL